MGDIISARRVIVAWSQVSSNRVPGAVLITAVWTLH